MFDAAVIAFGRHIESKLREVDEDGNLKNDLRSLLDIPLDKAELRALTLHSLKMLEIEARNPRSGIVID